MGNIESTARFSLRYAAPAASAGAIVGGLIGFFMKKSQIATDGLECVLGDMTIFILAGALVGLLLGLLAGVGTLAFLTDKDARERSRDRRDRYGLRDE